MKLIEFLQCPTCGHTKKALMIFKQEEFEKTLFDFTRKLEFEKKNNLSFQEIEVKSFIHNYVQNLLKTHPGNE